MSELSTASPVTLLAVTLAVTLTPGTAEETDDKVEVVAVDLFGAAVDNDDDLGFEVTTDGSEITFDADCEEVTGLVLTVDTTDNTGGVMVDRVVVTGEDVASVEGVTEGSDGVEGVIVAAVELSCMTVTFLTLLSLCIWTVTRCSWSAASSGEDTAPVTASALSSGSSGCC